MLQILTEAELKAALPMREAIAVLRRAFAEPLPTTPQREHHEVDSGVLLVMPAWSTAAVGVKLVTVNPANKERGLPSIHGSYILFDPHTLAPCALIDGSLLTGLRTAAVSGLVTDALARKEARRLVIFGAGVQARWHLEAMLSVRDIEEVAIVSRTEPSARVLVEETEDVAVRVGTVDDIAAADIICTCTTSPKPLFDGASLPEGCHVNAVGAFRPDARELDSTAMARSRLVVETRGAALAEAGEILIPMAEAAITEDAIVADIADMIAGTEVRRSPEDITVFVSVGAAFEDLIVATAMVDALAD